MGRIVSKLSGTSTNVSQYVYCRCKLRMWALLAGTRRFFPWGDRVTGTVLVWVSLETRTARALALCFTQVLGHIPGEAAEYTCHWGRGGEPVRSIGGGRLRHGSGILYALCDWGQVVGLSEVRLSGSCIVGLTWWISPQPLHNSFMWRYYSWR